jgi:hypothetical protein
MNNLISFNDFSLNEGKIRRGALQVIMAAAITFANIKSFFKGKEHRAPYRVGKIMANVLDFTLTLKKDPDLLDYYEGNILDEYKKLHGTDMIEDLDYVLDLIKKEIDKETDVLKTAKNKSFYAKLKEIRDAFSDLAEINSGGGFIFNKKTGEKSYFQGRLNKLASGVYAGDKYNMNHI